MQRRRVRLRKNISRLTVTVNAMKLMIRKCVGRQDFVFLPHLEDDDILVFGGGELEAKLP